MSAKHSQRCSHRNREWLAITSGTCTNSPPIPPQTFHPWASERSAFIDLLSFARSGHPGCRLRLAPSYRGRAAVTAPTEQSGKICAVRSSFQVVMCRLQVVMSRHRSSPNQALLACELPTDMSCPGVQEFFGAT